MTEKAKILIIDDEVTICKSCEKIFIRGGHNVTYVTSGKESLNLLMRETFDVIFTDLKMMDIGGMEVIQTVKQKYPETVVVVITGYATVSSAIETMRQGAFDFLPKPFTPQELNAVLDKAMEKRLLIKASKNKIEDSEVNMFEGMIGSSPAILDMYTLIKKVAPTDATVLIIGESGTGKDLTAKAIHYQSSRKKEKYFAIDVSTLTSTLLESELFGHVKGSFTGAYQNRIGIFESADKGTIFLDEIGNLTLETQSRLLRVLQEKEIIPVGCNTVKKVDVRLIFATNADLKQLVSENKFREDLYYRLNVFPIRLPSLRERREDIPLLVCHFLRKYSNEFNRPVPEIMNEAMDMLMNYHWPGNVRELEHTMERLTILVEDNKIMPIHVSSALFRSDVQSASNVPHTIEELKELKRKIKESAIHEIEKLFIQEALMRNDWNVTKAADEVMMQRTNFQALMKKYNIRKNKLTT